MTVDDGCREANRPGKAGARARGVREPANWRQRLRTRIVSRGIAMMCGSGDDVRAAAVTDLPLVSGAVRLAWLKALGAVGVKRFVATSGLGYDFVCHTDDRANFPFYYPRAYQAELELCAAWLHGDDRPVVYDIGANGGFVSTHLAQMLAGRRPRIYAFEPVPTTFAKLTQSVQRLGLQASVHPVAAAVVDNPGPVRISYSERNSLLAQISPRGLNPRAGSKLAQAEGITLDGFFASVGTPAGTGEDRRRGQRSGGLARRPRSAVAAGPAGHPVRIQPGHAGGMRRIGAHVARPAARLRAALRRRPARTADPVRRSDRGRRKDRLDLQSVRRPPGGTYGAPMGGRLAALRAANRARQCAPCSVTLPRLPPRTADALTPAPAGLH